MEDKPNSGSEEAQEQGCISPIRDILEPLHNHGVINYCSDETKCYSINEAEQAINAYILGEILELIGEDENKKVVDWDCPCGTQHHLESDYYQRNQLRQELRNKGIKKFGGK